MRRLAGATVLWLGLGQVAVAEADGTVVASTDGEAAVLDALTPMLEAPVAVGAAPTELDLAPLFAWVQAADATYGVVIDRATRRVYVAIPGERRLLERVLPRDADPYVVAVSATELWELARYGEPAPTPAPTPPVDGGETEAPDRPTDPVTRESPHRSMPWTVFLEGALSVGLDERLVLPDPGVSVALPLGSSPFTLEIGLLAGGRSRSRNATPGGPIELTYARRTLEARVGYGFATPHLTLRPVVVLRLDWVHAEARALEFVGGGTDDRLAGRVGVGLDALVPVGRRLVLGASLGAETLVGRAPYVALGARVLDEPAVALTARVVVGLTFPDTDPAP